MHHLLCLHNATHIQGVTLLVTNPGIANAIAGLATSASYQSGVDRAMLWMRRNHTVEPFNVTVEEMVAKSSDLRDKLDGPLVRVKRGLMVGWGGRPCTVRC